MIPSERQSHFGSTLWMCVALAISLTACSSGGDPETGTVELALEGSAKGSVFTLVDATFDIEGVEAHTLDSNASQDATLTTELPVGSYTVTLRDGWRLLETTEGSETEVAATLVSSNPQSFDIGPNALTTVNFAFETGDGAVSFGVGTLGLGIEVQKLLAREVVFSEVMKNPVALADSDGEWLELSNLGSAPLDLTDCRIERDGSGFTISTPLAIAAGAQVTFASSNSPGFTPSYVYSGLSLPNSGAFELVLSCGEERLDSVVVDPAATPNAAGASVSLDLERAARVGNDDASSWCDAVDSFNSDLGTPGSPNPPCP